MLIYVCTKHKTHIPTTVTKKLRKKGKKVTQKRRKNEKKIKSESD
jgi:hypothetical protein